jgi:hypothetical protein|tara:strand:- start:12723 stop:13004 length:282 start_codon:yes stop_codon:yes gene_type:complete
MSLIVSVTSISSRLPVLRHTLISLLDQHCKPDRIVLLLSKEPYLMDDGVNDLPPWLDAMVARRDIELQWVENTGVGNCCNLSQTKSVQADDNR